MTKTIAAPRAGKKANDRIAERRRRELLDAAFALIAEKGLEGLRTRDIAARASVNVATLHYYFATKEALIVALVRHVRDVFMAPEERRAKSPKDHPLAHLAAHLASAWRSFEENPQLATVLLELTLRARRDKVARQTLRAIHASWNGLVETILRQGVAAGDVRKDIDLRLGAAIVTSFIMGAATQSACARAPSRSRMPRPSSSAGSALICAATAPGNRRTYCGSRSPSACRNPPLLLSSCRRTRGRGRWA